jgi:hypothetical protein
MEKQIGYIGMVTGLLGSWFVASGDLALAGWLLFAVSNFAWVVQGTLTKNWPLVIMQAGFIGSTMLGIINNA